MTIAQPEDHLSSTFTYKFQSGAVLTLPKFKKIMTFGRARRYRNLPESEQMFSLIEEICDERALAVLDDMDTDETEAFMNAWQADSDVTLGESVGSSTSTTSTATPSSTTSADSTSAPTT